MVLTLANVVKADNVVQGFQRLVDVFLTTAQVVGLLVDRQNRRLQLRQPLLEGVQNGNHAWKFAFFIKAIYKSLNTKHHHIGLFTTSGALISKVELNSTITEDLGQIIHSKCGRPD